MLYKIGNLKKNRQNSFTSLLFSSNFPFHNKYERKFRDVIFSFSFFLEEWGDEEGSLFSLPLFLLFFLLWEKIKTKEKRKFFLLFFRLLWSIFRVLSLLCLVAAEHLGTMIVQCCRANCTLITRNCGTDAVLSGSIYPLRWLWRSVVHFASME